MDGVSFVFSYLPDVLHITPMTLTILYGLYIERDRLSDSYLNHQGKCRPTCGRQECSALWLNLLEDKPVSNCINYFLFYALPTL